MFCSLCFFFFSFFFPRRNTGWKASHRCNVSHIQTCNNKKQEVECRFDKLALHTSLNLFYCLCDYEQVSTDLTLLNATKYSPTCTLQLTPRFNRMSGIPSPICRPPLSRLFFFLLPFPLKLKVTTTVRVR